MGVAKSWIRLSDFTFTFHFHALEKEMATHSSVLAWRTPGTGEPGGLPSMGSHRVEHDWSDLAAAAWRSIRPSRTNTKKRCPLHHRELECKNRKSRDTWNNRQVWSWSTKWSRAKANRVLPREHPPTTQEKTLHMDITDIWTLTYGQYWNQIDYILCSRTWRSSIQL